MKDKRESIGGSGISISSYFQRLPSSQTASQFSQSSSNSGQTENSNQSDGKKTRNQTEDEKHLVGCRLEEKSANELQVPSSHPEPASEGRKTKIKHL